VRYAEPAEFDRWKQIGESYGIGHVEASPLTRSSYHAKGAAESVAVPVAVSVGDLGGVRPAVRNSAHREPIRSGRDSMVT
jgi:hypothetical protein